MMKLPDKLLQQVTIGTMNKSKPEKFDDLLSNEIIQSLDMPYESRLLLQIASYALANQAGFIAAISSEPFEPPIHEKGRSAISSKATKHFTMMLTGGYDIELLPEWCRLVAQSQQHLPDEFAPTILDFGNKLETTRIYLRAILSEHAKWIAQISERSNWAWVLQTPAFAEKQLGGINAEREARVISIIYNTPRELMGQHVLPHLAIYLQTWSEDLAQAFLNYILREPLGKISEQSAYRDAIENFAYYAPIDLHNKLIHILKSSGEEWVDELLMVKRISDFRHEMHDSIFVPKLD